MVREEDVEWNYMLYMNDIEIVRLSWFTADLYQDYFRFAGTALLLGGAHILGSLAAAE